MSKSTDNWMTEEGGIPHKNGSVRFYLIGIEEGVFAYLGWFDMTNWEKGWKKVWKAAQERHGDDEFDVIRHDQLLDLASNVKWAFEEALEDKDETTWLWWYRQEKKSKGEKK